MEIAITDGAFSIENIIALYNSILHERIIFTNDAMENYTGILLYLCKIWKLFENIFESHNKERSKS